jgi:hypothetical protein
LFTAWGDVAQEAQPGSFTRPSELPQTNFVAKRRPPSSEGQVRIEMQVANSHVDVSAIAALRYHDIPDIGFCCGIREYGPRVALAHKNGFVFYGETTPDKPAAIASWA